MEKSHEEKNGLSLAARLRQLRISVGFSQQNVANLLNINRSTYTYYETGKTSPDPATLYRIAQIFNVPIAIFFEEERSSLSFRDSGGDSEKSPMRSPKKVSKKPERIGQLASAEKELVGYLRDKNLSADDLLVVLRERFDKPDQKK